MKLISQMNAFYIMIYLLNPHGSDETICNVFLKLSPTGLLNPHGSDETLDATRVVPVPQNFLTHTVQMKPRTVIS